MALSIHGVQPTSVFALNGLDENSATFALGWTLDSSSHFLRLLGKAVFGKSLRVSEVTIALQKHAADGGYTDIELQSGRCFHAILEAKRWWNVPTLDQFKRYLPRLTAEAAERQRLISVSSADNAQARRHLPSRLDNAEIVHFSWSDLQKLAKKAHKLASGIEEKFWLRQLIQHLQEFASMERQRDNKVFVVSLGRDPMVAGKTHTWIDVVEKDHRYFHPVGNTWPVQPPNYIGFRYGGRLQSVHHIDGFEVVENLAKYNRKWLETDADHFVYRLGPPMRPAKEVKTGNIFRNGRVWCAIDTLLSGAFDTISDARDETQRRLAEVR
jgi:hypothetical protein